MARTSKIGGQAVLEGVMMRGESSMATAVRGPEGQITIESSRFTPSSKRGLVWRFPVIRGIVNFCSMLYFGMGILMRSAEVMGEDIEPSRFEKWLAKKTKIDLLKAAMAVALVLGIAFAVALFIVLPEVVVTLIFKIEALAPASVGVRNLVTGIFRIVIFILYIAACSKMKEIDRLFRYHGAEHKTINAYEHDEELTVENVRKYTTVHRRCGTTFLFLVMVVGILVNSALSFLPGYGNLFARIGYKILFLPLVAGISYEFLKLFAKYDNILFRIISAPGLWLQKLTTKEPDDSMLEVAIAAFNKVAEMDADPDVPTTKFVVQKPYKTLVERLEKVLPPDRFDASDREWILCEATGRQRSLLSSTRYVSQEVFDKALALAGDRAAGKPLQYVLGYTEFYGYRISVTPDVLIPRPETELLAEKVIAACDGKTVWDVCTGSGAIAVAVSLKGAPSAVYASDISPEALETARANARDNGADIEFFEADLLGKDGLKADLIVCNPPYIPSADIDNLQPEVKDFEPRAALDGGEDGLDFYRRLADDAPARLNEGGTLFMEIGIGQKDEIARIFKNWQIEFFEDYGGIPRMAAAVLINNKE